MVDGPDYSRYYPLMKKFKNFQIRGREPLGNPECPYLYRYSIVLFGISFRLHHWIRSDDNRFFHDHACDLISIPLKGFYYNVVPRSDTELNTLCGIRHKATPGHFWRAKAEDKHYLEIPEGGCWTLVIFGKMKQKWGFYVNNNPKKTEYYHRFRPLRYFHRYGIIQDETYTGIPKSGPLS